MLDLAERIRAASGSELDDAAILAVAEATGAPVDYVRLALRFRPQEQKRSLLHRAKTEYLGLEPEARRNVIGGLLGAGFALTSTLSLFVDSSFVGLLGVVQIFLATLAVYSCAVAKDSRSAAITGAVVCGIGFVFATLFQALFRVQGRIDAVWIIPFTLGGALLGLTVNKLISKHRPRFGLKDPIQERQELLRQLVQLQEKLRSGEQSIAFLSVDIVGSTKMKQDADPLSIEFTFNEYHQFVERIVRKYGGRIHSTAGDGMTCAFDTAQQAFGSAKNIQAGMIELNAFGNKTGIPLVLRAGIHIGSVVTPKPGDIASLNFAHVIDIAAHMQKIAPPGGIVVSGPAANEIPGGSAAVGFEQVETQNVIGFVWQARTAPLPSAPGTPPPFPGT